MLVVRVAVNAEEMSIDSGSNFRGVKVVTRIKKLAVDGDSVKPCGDS
jgi:hypothetical protein